MKLLEVKTLDIPEIKTIRFARFTDMRGYFTESYRDTEFDSFEETCFLHGSRFVQVNESYSRPDVIRGLHFQWNPYMGKLVRTIRGRMIDFALDIRKGSPTLGKIVAYDMPSKPSDEFNEWIWVPPGFAHGNLFTEETTIEYMCTGQYSPGCEAGISPLAKDIDWSLVDKGIKDLFDEVAHRTELMTEKDRDGMTLAGWLADERSENFIYEDP